MDFEKPFDKIEHQAILDILRWKGFGERWFEWIRDILSSGTFSILLNGVPGKVFHRKRGLRQGDPLSPLLFVLAADLLQSLVNNLKNQGVLRLPFPWKSRVRFPHSTIRWWYSFDHGSMPNSATCLKEPTPQLCCFQWAQSQSQQVCPSSFEHNSGETWFLVYYLPMPKGSSSFHLFGVACNILELVWL